MNKTEGALFAREGEKLHCAVCGSINVEVQIWASPNTCSGYDRTRTTPSGAPVHPNQMVHLLVFVSEPVFDFDVGTYKGAHCHDCREHVSLVAKKKEEA